MNEKQSDVPLAMVYFFVRYDELPAGRLFLRSGAIFLAAFFAVYKNCT